MNGEVEYRNAVLLNCARAAMYTANFNKETRKKLWADTIRCTETIHNSMAASRNAKSTNELFYGKKLCQSSGNSRLN